MQISHLPQVAFRTNLIWVFMHIVPLHCVSVVLHLSFSATWTKIAGLTVQYAVHLLSHNSPLSFKPSPVKYWALSGLNVFYPALRHKWGLCTIVYCHRQGLGSAQWWQSKPESLSDIQKACHYTVTLKKILFMSIAVSHALKNWSIIIITRISSFWGAALHKCPILIVFNHPHAGSRLLTRAIIATQSYKYSHKKLHWFHCSPFFTASVQCVMSLLNWFS